MPTPRSNAWQHGTNYGYIAKRCRCDECRAAHREHAAKQRAKDPEADNAYKREYYAANRDRVLENQKRWQRENPEKVREYQRKKYENNKERILEYSRVYYLIHREEYIARSKGWKEANTDRARELARAYYHADIDKSRETARAAARKYREANPEKARERFRIWAATDRGRLYFRAQAATRRGAPYTPESLEWIARLVDPLCTYCGEPASSIDHIVPVSKGGTGERDNLTPACKSCNSKKRNMPLDVFLQRKDR